MLCDGGVKVFVVHTACAEPFNATFTQPGMSTPSDLNVTDPVGTTGDGGVGTCDGWIATVAVKLIVSPWFAGFRSEIRLVCESNRSTGVLTVFVFTFSGVAPSLKLTVPKFETWAAPGGTPVKFGGLFTVTWKVIVTLSPGRSVPMLIGPTVSPAMDGATAFTAAFLNVAGFIAACGARVAGACGVARNRLVEDGA